MPAPGLLPPILIEGHQALSLNPPQNPLRKQKNIMKRSKSLKYCSCAAQNSVWLMGNEHILFLFSLFCFVFEVEAKAAHSIRCFGFHANFVWWVGERKKIFFCSRSFVSFHDNQLLDLVVANVGGNFEDGYRNFLIFTFLSQSVAWFGWECGRKLWRWIFFNCDTGSLCQHAKSCSLVRKQISNTYNNSRI